MTSDEFIAWLHRQDKPKTRAMEQRYYGDPARYVRFDQEKGTNMRHSAKTVQIDGAFAEREPIDKVLGIWAAYLSLKDRSAPGGYSHPQDAKDFMATGEAVEAMVNNLSRHQWWAVRKSMGICTQWIFQDASYEDALTTAKATLSEKMRINVATARYFC